MALRQALAELKNVPDRGKLDRAFEDAADEAAKPKPDKEEIGGALERVFKYMKAAGNPTENAGKLLPPLTALAAWLGPLGHQLLSVLPPMPSNFPRIPDDFPVMQNEFPITWQKIPGYRAR